LKQLLLVLALALGGVTFMMMSSPQPTMAGGPASWPPLLTCPDTTGDGTVDLPNDILGVVLRFGTSYGETNPDSGLEYALIYDVSGGNVIDLPNDVLGVILRFGDQCPLFDQQIALATQALMPYRDCQNALADGYVQTTQFVAAMGIHLQKVENIALPVWSGSVENTNDQIRNPPGLICTDSNPSPGIDEPGDLIGTWGASPDPNVCPFYGIDPQDCSFTEPVGYGTTNTDEDNQDLNATDRAWHSHFNMCLGGTGSTAWVIADVGGVTEANCLAGAYGPCTPTCTWFDFYSWMSHMYAFIPNNHGRFLMWSDNVPGEGQTAGSAAGAVASFDPSNAQLCFFNPDVAAKVAAGES